MFWRYARTYCFIINLNFNTDMFVTDSFFYTFFSRIIVWIAMFVIYLCMTSMVLKLNELLMLCRIKIFNS